jgi:hypothetical protein
MKAVWFRAVVLTVASVALVATTGTSALGEQNLGYAGRPECTPFSPERPYVCDIGAPRPLSIRSFNRVLSQNDAILAHVRRIGVPDWAEIQKVATDAPWTNYEIRLYYRDYDRMYAFGRAFILDQPEVALLRHQGPIPPGKFPPVQVVRMTDAELEAQRAERAAAEAEARAEVAERDAARAEAIANTASREFKESLVKH